MSLLLLLAAIFYAPPTAGQTGVGWDTIQVSKIKFFYNIKEHTGLYVDSSEQYETMQLELLPRLDTIAESFNKKVPGFFIGKPIFLQFTLHNDLV